MLRSPSITRSDILTVQASPVPPASPHQQSRFARGSRSPSRRRPPAGPRASAPALQVVVSAPGAASPMYGGVGMGHAYSAAALPDVSFAPTLPRSRSFTPDGAVFTPQLSSRDSRQPSPRPSPRVTNYIGGAGTPRAPPAAIVSWLPPPVTPRPPLLSARQPSPAPHRPQVIQHLLMSPTPPCPPPPHAMQSS